MCSYVSGKPPGFVGPLGLAKCSPVDTYANLNKPSDASDKLEAHEYIRASNIRGQTGAARGSSEQLNNPSVALSNTTHARVHAFERVERANLNMPAGTNGDLATEMRVMDRSLESAGVPRGTINALRGAAEDYASKLGLK